MEDRTSPSPQKVWSIASAEDRIVVVTSELPFYDRIRHIFSNEPYELITVSNFEDQQNALINTSLCIVHYQDDSDFTTIKYIRDSEFWYSYPVIRISSPEIFLTKIIHTHHPGKYHYAFEFNESSLGSGLVLLSKSIIKSAGEEYII